MTKIARIAVAVCILVAMCRTGFASSLTIVPTFDSTITGDANAAQIESTIDQAIQVYETIFNNPITVNITFSELSTGVGQSSFDLYPINYSQFYTALGNETPTPQDAIALANLPSGANNPVTGTPDMLIKPANALALGINLGLPPNASDGTVSVNTALTAPGSPGTTGQYSLLTMLEHEIDVVLGLGSTLGLTLPGDESTMPSPEDLYRYDAMGNHSFTTAPNAVAYFSLDGKTLLTQFNNTGVGDYGDWAPSASPQVQDAVATIGSSPGLGANEITALNAIGYTIVSTPEPATWWLLPPAILLLGYRRARYTKRT